MTQYLITMFQPEADPPEPDVLNAIMAEVDALNEDLKKSGAWVFAGGLQPPDTSTTLNPSPDGSVVVSHGPFAQVSDQFGGFWIISAANLDTALSWARKAALATTLPVELRAFRVT